ncbi:hypothetical protein [Microvirga sp. TS319]|uniref:hypothetical protein n=1 Tax=Microvirga sp. TS319 TaxID=3241165 RepID=UPI00351A81F1
MTITVSSSADIWSRTPDNDHDQARESDIARQIDDVLAILAAIEASFETNRQCLLDWAGPEVLKLRFLKQLDVRQTRQREWLVQKLVELHHCKTMVPLAMKS